MPTESSRLVSFVAFLLPTAVPLFAEASEAVPVADLEPYLVTATRRETPVTEAPAAVSLIDKETIQQASAQLSLDEPLRGVPGVFVLNPYNFAQDTRIAIRGFGARSDFGIRGIRLIVDGIPATLPDGQGSVDGIDLGSAERIELIRGPASALYGAASGGVIRIETESAPSAPFLETRHTAGDDGLYKAQLKSGLEDGPVNALVSLSALEFDGFRDHSRTEERKFNAKVRYALDSGASFELIANLVDLPKQDDPGGLTAAEVEADRRQARDRNLLFDAGEELTQEQVGLGYLLPFASGHELELRAYAVHRDFANRLPFESGGQVAFDRFFAGGSLLHRFESPDLRLLSGLELGRQRDDRRNFDNLEGSRGPLALDQIETVDSLGAFVLVERELPADLTASAALRFDRVDFEVDDRFTADGDDSGTLDFEAASPMLGLQWGPHPGLNLYANLSTAFETPATTELDNPSGGGFNDALDPQTATSFEVGLKGRLEAPQALSYELVLFSVDVEDSLVPFELADSPDREFYRNAGASRHRGLEGALSIRLAEPLELSLAYTYSDFEYEDFDAPGGDFAGNRIPGIPRHLVNLRLDYRHASGVFASWNSRWVGALYADDANATEVAGYRVSDLRFGLERSVGNWSLTAFLGVDNLFDRDYDANIRINAFGDRFYEPAPGRSLFGGLGLRYDFP